MYFFLVCTLDLLYIHLSGVFYVSQAAAQLMLKKRKGRIVNISSIVGKIGNPGQVGLASFVVTFEKP